MSVVDDIISGKDFQTQQKKKKKSVTEQIIAPYTNLENNLRNSTKNQNQLKEQQAQEFFDYLGWNNKKKKKGLFNLNIDTSSGLSSGFDILDPFISLGSSTIDAGANFMSGVENIAVQTTNLLGEGIATVSDLTGNKEFAQNLRDTIGGKNEDYNKKLNDKLLFKKAADAFDDYSIFGETADEIFQGAGYYGGMVGLQSLGVPWYVTAGTTSYGSALQKAYENDASSTEANLYALISAAGEIASERISGGLKLPGTGKTMETLTGRLIDKVGNKGAKAALGFLTNTFGEGAEEVVSGLISSIGEGLTFGSEEDKNALENIWKSSTDYLKTEAGRDFIMGVAVTALTNGVNPQTYQAAREGRNMVTGYTQNEQRVIDAATQEAIQQQQEETGKKLTKKEIAQIEEQVKEDLSKGFIDTNTIEKTLGFDGQQRITEVENMLGRELTQEEKQKELFDARNKFYEGLQNDSYLMESLSEEGKKSQKFEVNINDYQNEAQRNIVQKAIDSGVLNNTRATHEYVDFVSKLCADKGMDFDFTNNEKLKGTRFALEGKTINGFVEGNKITVNVDSNTSLYKTVGHEITHTLEGSDLYTELQSSLKSYLGEREWNNRINELKDLYKDVKDANVENELTADLIGETLFTDKKFINNLSTQNRNVFQKIYDEIKYMYKVATAGSKEKRQLEKVKKLFDEAYRTNTNVSEETKLSVKEGEQVAPFNNEKEIQQQYDNIKNQRDDLRQNLFELRRQRNEIIDTIPNYSMFKQYDELTDIDKQIDDNVEESKKLYSQQQELEQKLNEAKELKKQQEIEEVNKKSTPFKEKQFKVLQKTNPMLDNYHTGIRQPGEIMTWQEAMQDAEKTEDGYSWGDFSKEDAQRALDSKKITIYSSYPIKNGVFVSTSLAQAQMYAGGEGNRVYSKTVNPDFVAWINVDEGQYANVGRNFENNTKYSLTKDNQGRNLTQEQQEYFKDSKVVDENGNLLTMYHATSEDFNVFDKTKLGKTTESIDSLLGFHFSPSDYVKNIYGDKIKEVYLDSKKLLDFRNLTEENYNDLRDIGIENVVKNNLEDQGIIKEYLVESGKINDLKEKGYDGLAFDDWVKGEYIVFNSNQIKNVDNTNPTSSPDIRYSLSESGQTTDSNGKKLSIQQLEYFKDSKVVDNDGRLLEVYHGTPNYDFNEFAGGVFLTDDYMNADGYAGGERVIEAYANITNPLEIDCKGAKWDNLDTPYGTSTREVVSNLDESKYDGIIFRNVNDNWFDDEIGMPGDVFYAVNSNQVKNVDNENPTSNPDIRYSISKQDNQGRELSEQQLEYFKDSKVVDNEGRLLEVYHGTNDDFTIFDKSYLGSASGDLGFLGDGFYFATHKGEAAYYGGKNMSVYLNVTNPFNIQSLQDYNGMHLRGVDSNSYIEIKNLVDMNPEWRQIEVGYGYTYGDIADVCDEVLNSIKVEDLGITDDGNRQFKVTTGGEFEIVNAVNNYKTEEVIANAFSREMRNRFGYINGSDVLQNITSEARFRKITNEAPIKTFSDVLQENGYDGIIQGDNAAYTDEIVVFNSNQIKNVDNLNPTTNDDIRLSMSRNNDIAPYYPGQITGEDVRLQEEIAPTVETTQDLDLPFDVTFDEVKEALDLPKDVDRTEYLKVSNTNESTGQEYENQYSPFDKAKKDLAQKKLEKFIEKETYKAIDQATNVAARYGEFNKSQKKQIKADLNRFANMTAEQLTNADTYNEFKDIVSQYADREMNFVDEHLKEVKNDIRKRKFNVSDIKNQITDYADFRRQYFGRLNLTDTGSSIDSQYQELSELYPEYFSPDVTTEADMLNTLAEFMDLDTTITEKYRLSEEEIDRITSKAFSTLVREAPTEQQIQEFEAEVDRAVERRRSEVRRQQLLDSMGVTIHDIAAGKDISSLGYQRTDPIRLHEKVFGYEVGNKMNDATIRHTIHNEAESMRWTNTEKTEIKDLGIKARSKESAAVQKYGEGEYVNDLGEVVKYGDRELAAEFPNVATQNKIKQAAEVLRGKYDRYIDQINEVLTDLGYDAIPKRKNYFRHFMELNDKFSQWGTPFNRQTMQEQDLPTDINGLTDQFKPGKSYFASALERKGIKTTYDAITGIDGYIDSAANLIFHTEDIQRYRALAKLIRETYGQQHGLDNIDIMTEAEKNQRIEDVYGNKLSKYAAWLDEQANALAGKKAGIDRAVERIFGRRVYTAANTLKTQVGSNMTGFGVRSAMSNFASVVQGISKTNKISFIKGTISTINNMIHDDGMTQKSDFLMGRYGTEQLSQKAWQKIANAGQVFMSATDHFTSNQIWRSKYFENLSKGMTEEQAIRNADDFAARVMGNRVKGSTAEIFNSKTLGFLTQFQLEVNNYWSNIAHDNKIDLKSGNKSGASVVFQLGQLAAFSYIFNGFMKGLTGSEIMLDPIDLLKQIFNPDDDDKEKSLEERARGVMGDIINQLPMASIFTGGRIPIQEAFKGAETGFKYLTNQTNEYGQNYTVGNVFDDSLESLAYLFMPTGYGQLRKTYKGTIDLDYDVNLNPFEGAIGVTKRPVRGSYTDTGNLRFTADNSISGRIKSALFGQYANSEAQDYINSGYKTISKSKIEELQALEMSSSEYKRWQKDFNDAIATTVEIDGDKYAKYKDDYGNIYFYNKDTRTLLDSDYAESDIDVKTLEKVDKNELIFDYVNNYGFTDEQRQFLYDENFTNTTTDKYGYEKYTGKEVDKKGKTVTKNYYYDPDTDTLYDSKYKEVDSSKLDELTKVAPSKTIQDAEGFDSYEEFDYSYRNPEKYNFIRQTGTYERYKKDKAYKEAVDWSYNTPVNYTMSKAFDENIVAYKEYMDTLNDIKADKDKNGKSISGSRKKKVFNYINSLDLNTEQKAILARSQYSSYDDYGYEIVNYLNNQTNISLEEEYSILEKLGYKIDRNRGTVSW